jgi:hypothetical protein
MTDTPATHTKTSTTCFLVNRKLLRIICPLPHHVLGKWTRERLTATPRAGTIRESIIDDTRGEDNETFR